MKKTSIIFLQIIFLLQIVSCQNKTIYELNKFGLVINTITNRYSLWVDTVNTDPRSSQVIAVPDISAGKVSICNNTITCIDTISKKKIILNQVDEYKLIVITGNYGLNRNDILYAIVISDKTGKPFQWLKWKDGMRHGEWSEDLKDGVKFTLYNRGKLIRTYFKTYNELRKERLEKPMRL